LAVTNASHSWDEDDHSVESDTKGPNGGVLWFKYYKMWMSLSAQTSRNTELQINNLLLVNTYISSM